MTSGCILGACPVCNELIWEDEMDIYQDTLIHERCKKKFISNKLLITENQFEKISNEQKIKKELEELRENIKSSFDYYSKEINRLEALLNK